MSAPVIRPARPDDAAALAYAQYERPAFAILGLVLSVGWLIADKAE